MKISAINAAAPRTAKKSEVKFGNRLSNGVEFFVKDGFFKEAAKLTNEAVQEVVKRAEESGKFLKWIGLPKRQLERVNEIYTLAAKFKSQTGTKTLNIEGIGGSLHTVEHMANITGVPSGRLNTFSDLLDPLSLVRFAKKVKDFENSAFLVASKSGTTFETKDAYLKTEKILTELYRAKGHSAEEAQELANKHFIAVTDASNKSELRQASDAKGYLGKLFIHDDVGGRYSAFDDHVLFSLAYAGVPKDYVVRMLKSAHNTSFQSLLSDFHKNIALKQGFFWAKAKLEGFTNSVHAYLGDIFVGGTEKWGTQLYAESRKETARQILGIPSGMHHSSEAHFNPFNKFASAITDTYMPLKALGEIGVQNPLLKQFLGKDAANLNTQEYSGALKKAYSEIGPFFKETLYADGYKIAAEDAGKLTQTRHFATIYEGIIERMFQGKKQPEVFPEVLQPHVEHYKKYIREADLVAGR